MFGRFFGRKNKEAKKQEEELKLKEQEALNEEYEEKIEEDHVEAQQSYEEAKEDEFKPEPETIEVEPETERNDENQGNLESQESEESLNTESQQMPPVEYNDDEAQNGGIEISEADVADEPDAYDKLAEDDSSAEADESTEVNEQEELDKSDEPELIEEEAPKGFFARLKEGLSKTRNGITKQIDNVLKSFTKIDEELFEELEEILITSDVGVETTLKIMDNLRRKVKEQKLTESNELRELLKSEIREILGEDNSLVIPDNGKQSIILVIGVNGVGKTTTIGKIGYLLKQQKKQVLFAAADTFRAAAIEQLEVWGKRTGIDVIKHNEGSDPSAVIFDAIKAAISRKTDVLICDTAGRLHNKKNLMEELKKIWRIIEREYPDSNKEVLLALDATTGQNAVNQAKLFSEVANITGIVLTKLDGTAKGGIVIAIKDQLNIPVKFIGVGEKMYDLQRFNGDDFINAMFDEE